MNQYNSIADYYDHLTTQGYCVFSKDRTIDRR